MLGGRLFRGRIFDRAGQHIQRPGTITSSRVIGSWFQSNQVLVSTLVAIIAAATGFSGALLVARSNQLHEDEIIERGNLTEIDTAIWRMNSALRSVDINLFRLVRKLRPDTPPQTPENTKIAPAATSSKPDPSIPHTGYEEDDLRYIKHLSKPTLAAENLTPREEVLDEIAELQAALDSALKVSAEAWKVADRNSSVLKNDYVAVVAYFDATILDTRNAISEKLPSISGAQLRLLQSANAVVLCQQNFMRASYIRIVELEDPTAGVEGEDILLEISQPSDCQYSSRWR
jgi:hypothetical protein